MGITILNHNVAPLTGAWIETYYSAHIWLEKNVAPLTGAWIETKINLILRKENISRTPHGCVD